MEKLLDRLKIDILGLGGAGLDALNTLIDKGLEDVQFSAVDTDLQTLQLFAQKHSQGAIENYNHPTGEGTAKSFLIGYKQTRGLSTGGNVELGQQLIPVAKELFQTNIQPNLLFIIAAMGGGTGASLATTAAKEASDQGSLVIAFALMPFGLEGTKRWQQAQEALHKLEMTSDAVIVVPNDLLLQNLEPTCSVLDAFKLAHTWIYKAIHSISTILFKPGFINLDFASLRQVFTQKSGKALFALGQGSGENYIQEALEDLKACPLLHSLEQAPKADSILINLISSQDLSISAISNILNFINQHFGNKSKTTIGCVITPQAKPHLEICLIGTNDPGSSRGLGHLKEFENKPSTKPKKTGSHFLKKWIKSNDGAQSEFSFVSQGQMRGYFDQTQRNQHNGEDLDVPTYLRKGIKL